MSADLLTANITVLTDAASVGDLLIGVLFMADLSVPSGSVADAGAVTLPAGWEFVSLTSMIPTGDPRRLNGAVMVVQKKVTSAGTDAGVFTWRAVSWRPLKLYKQWTTLTTGATLTTHMQHVASFTTYRLTGVDKTYSSVVSGLANQLVRYPEVNLPYPVSGHLLRIGGIRQPKASGSLLPAAHTQRFLQGPLPYGGTGKTTLLQSTVDLSSVSTIAEASGTAVGDGFTQSIVVPTVAKPIISIVTPQDGAILDLGVPNVLQWDPPDGQDQQFGACYTLNPYPGGATLWWNGAAWQAGATAFGLTAQQDRVTVTPLTVTSGAPVRFHLQVWTQQYPSWSDFALATVTHRPTPGAPTLAISPTPSGGNVASRVPTLTVSNEVRTDGGPVVARQMEWRNAVTDELLASSSGSSPWALTVALPNLTQVKARARFQQGGGMWSAWAESTVTINVAKPSAPTVTASTVTNPTSGLPVTQLLVTAAAGVKVQVVRDGALVGEVTSAGPSIKVADMLAPAGPSTYTVKTLAAAVGSEYSNPTVVVHTPADADSWLYDPAHPETAVRAHVQTMSAESIDLHSTVHEPIGDPFVTVVAGTVARPRWSILWQHKDPTVIEKLVALLSARGTLILHGWDEVNAAGTLTRQPDYTFKPVGVIEKSRALDGPFTWRRVQADVVEAPRPTPGLTIITP